MLSKARLSFILIYWFSACKFFFIKLNGPDRIFISNLIGKNMILILLTTTLIKKFVVPTDIFNTIGLNKIPYKSIPVNTPIMQKPRICPEFLFSIIKKIPVDTNTQNNTHYSKTILKRSYPSVVKIEIL